MGDRLITCALCILLEIVACNAADCGPTIPNGQVHCYYVYSDCTFTCHKGYKKQEGISEIYCSAGRWMARSGLALDFCKQITCSPTISHGSIDPACSRTIDEYCSYSCDPGYVGMVPGTSIRLLRCNVSGEWNKQPCIRESSLCTSVIKNGYIDPTCSRQPGISSCSYYCDYGCTRNTSHLWLNCGTNAKWTVNTDRLCINCPHTSTSSSIGCPPYLAGGTLEYGCSRRSYSYCGFTCNTGCISKLSDRHRLYCNGAGYWEFLTSPCVCGERTVSPPSSENSYSSHTSTTIGLTVAVLTVFLILFVIIVFICRQRRRKAALRKSRTRNTLRAQVEYIYRGTTTPMSANRATNAVTSPYNISTMAEVRIWNQFAPNQTRSNGGLITPQYELEAPPVETLVVNLQGPPTYSTLNLARSETSPPIEPPPSYDDVSANPSEYKICG